MANMAQGMIEAIERFNAHTGCKLKVCIGIDTGALVAGVSGSAPMRVHTSRGEWRAAAAHPIYRGICA